MRGMQSSQRPRRGPRLTGLLVGCFALSASVLHAQDTARVVATPVLAGGAPTRAGAAAVTLVDDWGRRVVLPAAPRRIVSLAPHATELLAAAGLLGRLVAVDPNSDHPAEVKRLPRVASYPVPDVEALAALAPDLVVVWGAGLRAETLARLRSLGLEVYVSEPHRLDDVPSALERLAAISPDPAQTRAQAAQSAAGFARLREQYRGASIVPVFIQVSALPLLTLTDRDPIGDALRVCGAANVFGQAPGVVAAVGPEAVIAREPVLVLALESDPGDEPWRGLSMLAPRGPITLVRIDPAIQRPGPRWLKMLSRLCDVVDTARMRRSGPSVREAAR